MQKTEGDQDPYRVESVDRAMILLTLLAQRSRLSVTEAAAELGVVPSTAHRLLNTMAGRGFVAQGEDRLYRPGPALLAPGLRARAGKSVVALLRPVLQRLHDEVHETVHLQVMHDADVRFADGIEGDRGLRVSLRVGTRIPAYCASGGKAMLAAMPDAAVERLHAHGLRPWPSRSIVSVRQLVSELGVVRRRGYGINDGESELGVIAIGTAVLTPEGEPAAALSLAVPSPRYDARSETVAVERLLAARDEAQRLVADTTPRAR